MIARPPHHSDFPAPAIVSASSIMRVRSPRDPSHGNGIVMGLLPLPPSFNCADVIRRCEQEIAAMFCYTAVPLVDPLTNQPSSWRSWP